MLLTTFRRYITSKIEAQPSGLLVGAAGLLLLGIWGSIAFLTVGEKERAIEHNFRVNANLARAFEEYVGHLIEDANADLLFIKREYEKANAVTPVLEGRVASLRSIATNKIVIMSETGEVNASLILPSQYFLTADTDAFRFHRQTDSDELYISKPFVDRGTDTREFYISRRLNHPDGSFAGIAALNLQLSYFTDFFRFMNLGEEYLISLTGTDGIIRVRYEGTQGADGLGASIKDSVMLKESPAQPEGSWRGKSLFDGLLRLFSYRAMPEYGMVVLVGVTEQAALAEHYLHIRYYFSGGVLASLLVLGSFAGFYGMLYKRQRDLRLQQALFRISEIAAQATSLSELYHAIHDVINSLIPANHFYIALRQPQEERLYFVYRSDLYDFKRLSQPSANGLTEYVFRTERPLLANVARIAELETRGEISRQAEPPEDWLGVPLTTEEHRLGVMVVKNYDRENPFTLTTQAILQFVSGQVAQVILRKQQEEALRDQNRFTEAIISSVPGMLYLYEGNGQIVKWNKKHGEISGYTDEETKDLALPKWFADEESYLRIEQGIQRALTEGFAETEAELRRKDGSLIPMLFTAVGLQIEGKQYFTGVGVDISRLKQAERDLQQINQELERRVEDRTQELTAVNEEMTASNEEILAMNEELLKTNELLYNEVNIRKKAEAELTEAIEQLQTAQNYLIQSEKMAALGSLVAGVSHEINTPLGVGVTGASHLQEITRKFTRLCREGEPSRQDVTEYLEDLEDTSAIILKNLERAGSLIKSFKQVAVDQAHETRRQFRLRSYLEEVLTSMQPAIKKTRHQVSIECDDQIVLNSYPGALAQIITNLVMNSLIHAYDGNAAGQIRIQAQIRGNMAELVYSDDGKGIPPDFVSKIFDPFFTTRRGSGGTGLGLFVVYTVVTRQLSGSIECDSRIGQGTVFRMRFPAGDEKRDEE